MVKVYERADFPFKAAEILHPLLEQNLIHISDRFDNGTPSAYEITESGKTQLATNFNESELIEHIKEMQNPDQLLHLTKIYIDRKNQEKSFQ